MNRTTMNEPSPHRYFTVDEANRYVPKLTDWLREMKRHRDTMAALEEKIEPVIAKAAMNSGGRAGSDFAVALHRFLALAARIQEEGIILRDVASGLVDFPTWRFDRKALLCWQLGEEAVEHWHEEDAGFAGRKRLGEASESDFRAVRSDEDKI